MNDLYWLPGGNPGLKSEYGLSYELGLGYKSKSDLNPALNASVNAFGNR
jgi:iron complex outermembrane receptor protein